MPDAKTAPRDDEAPAATTDLDRPAPVAVDPYNPFVTTTAMAAAFHVASTLPRSSEKVMVLGLAWLTTVQDGDDDDDGVFVSPDAVAAITGLGLPLVENTLRKMAKDHKYVGRKAWLDATEHKQVAYTFVVLEG